MIIYDGKISYDVLVDLGFGHRETVRVSDYDERGARRAAGRALFDAGVCDFSIVSAEPFRGSDFS